MPFKGNNQPLILRLKDDKDLDSEIARFQADGYTIPPVDALYQGSDDIGKFIGLEADKDKIDATYIKTSKKEDDKHEGKTTIEGEPTQDRRKFEKPREDRPRFRNSYPRRGPIGDGKIRNWDFEAREGITRARRSEHESSPRDREGKEEEGYNRRPE